MMASRLLLDSWHTTATYRLREVWKTCSRSYSTRQESKPWKQKPNRRPRLSLVLTQDIHKLGVKGQVVSVKHGYGRNYLIPQEKAVYATDYNINELEAFKVEKGVSKLNEAVFLANYLSDKELNVRLLPGDTTAITEQHISRAFRQSLQLHVPIDCIELSEPITNFEDDNSVMVRLDEDTLVTVPVKMDISLTKKEQRKLDKIKSFAAKTAQKEVA